MRVKLAFLILIGSLLVEALAIEAPLLFPLLKGRVVDEADLLSKLRERHISDQLEMLENQTGAQVAVATVLSLDGYTIEEYANRLARHWALGQADKDNGALLLVAPNERKVRIEVGYGLEGELTDAMSARIIHEQILPEFRKGRFHTGITSGTDAMISVLGGQPMPAPSGRRATVAFNSVEGALYLALMIGVFMFFANMRDESVSDVRRRRRGLYQTGWGGGTYGGGGGFSSGGFGGGGGSFGGGGSSGGW
jgi:uncharacterized protein